MSVVDLNNKFNEYNQTVNDFNQANQEYMNLNQELDERFEELRNLEEINPDFPERTLPERTENEDLEEENEEPITEDNPSEESDKSENNLKKEEPKELSNLVHSLESVGGKEMSDLDILYIAGMAFESTLLTIEGRSKEQAYLQLGKQLESNEYISINAGNVKANKGLLGFVEDIEIELTEQQIQQYLMKTGEAVLTKNKPIEWNNQAKKAQELLNSKDAQILLKKILSDYGDGLDELNSTELYLNAIMANKMPVNQVKRIYEEFKKIDLSSKVTSLLEVKLDE